jgi:thioredoxin 1
LARESITELKASDFQGQTLKREGTLAVLFVATWCPFCVRFQPAFEEAAKEGKIFWALTDLSEDDNVLWDTFHIHTVPSIVVFKNGEAVYRKDGVRGRGLSQNDLKETIDKMRLLDRSPEG